MQEHNAIREAISERVDWVDYAKGICIIWVVTMYATNFVKEITHSIGWMQAVVNFGQPFRMPDFFLLSGLFVARVLNRPWRRYVDTKVIHFLYFYTLWVTLKFINLHLRDAFSADPFTLAAEYLWMFVEPPATPLWFIYVLALYFLAVRWLRNVPPAIVIPLAIALQVAVSWGPEMQWDFKVADKFARYFVFFYAGYLLSEHAFRLAAWMRAHAAAAIGILLGWAMLNQLMVSLHWTYLPGMQLALGFIGAFGVQVAATLLARRSWAGWLRYLGSHSLVVYLGFVVPLGMLRKFVDGPHAVLDLGTLSLVVMLLSIAGAIGLYWAVRPTPLKFLFERPAWATLGGARQRGNRSPGLNADQRNLAADGRTSDGVSVSNDHLPTVEERS
jgi:uncharacterized membrane protein YcfT